MGKWYLIYTKPRKEKTALQNLIAQGYEVLLPTFKLQKIIRNKKTIVEEPLFPRYLFIKLDEQGSQGVSPIRSTIGVSHLIKFGNALAQVPAEIIKCMLNINADTTIAASMVSGDLVRINVAPFKEMEALFSHFDGDERAVLLLNILERTVKGSFSLSAFSLAK